MAELIKCGALWSRMSKDKKTPYINGIIDGDKLPEGNKISVVIFNNKNKRQGNSPDYIVYLSEPKAARAPSAGQQDIFGGKGGGSDFDDDDVPF